MLARSTADGHELRFGMGSWHWDDERPRWFGWLTLLALLALTALAFAYVRRLLRPLDDIRAGALRFATAISAGPSPSAATTSWAIWRRRSTHGQQPASACFEGSAACAARESAT